MNNVVILHQVKIGVGLVQTRGISQTISQKKRKHRQFKKTFVFNDKISNDVNGYKSQNMT